LLTIIIIHHKSQLLHWPKIHHVQSNSSISGRGNGKCNSHLNLETCTRIMQTTWREIQNLGQSTDKVHSPRTGLVLGMTMKGPF